MLYRLINLVLTVLMLMPAGICTCDGGVVSCPDHPVHAPTRSPICVDGGQTRGHFEAAVAAKTGCDPLPHHCPAPRPHHPSCPAAASAADQATTERSWPSAAPDVFAATVVAPLFRRANERPARPARITAVSPPLFIAHCALLI